ncbi:hypothetical protein COEREDRAFT_6942 [Coemansia reversa NRRL 1564]|uniref:Micro-fibrillar-associated protein 1 C-terminal domain-containing protein n=1 Tax=Coemansia reversa (strain ATCC 12441 / NRRL 1564) TaxID=763665 RepID=A0A2G5BGP4_COERN|nr:hypothetical protein COEREDRAFT_6942 [Coemansia reversa NRRL 1564]|eukprot:PIA18208.1 hypothetical protein COEREDRAFT_6942 [Coemansia reversa NRRL 1564]
MEKQQKGRPMTTSSTKLRRYFPGKAPAPEVGNFSSSESEDDQKDAEVKLGAQQIAIAKVMTRPTTTTITMESQSRTGSESEDDERELLRARLRARQLAAEEHSSNSSSDSDSNSNSVHRRRAALRQIQQKKREQQSEEPGTSVTCSSEPGSTSELETTDSDDGYGLEMMAKPIYVPKAQRKTVGLAGETSAKEGLVPKHEMQKWDRQDASVRIAASEARRMREEPQADPQDPMTVDDTDDVDVDAEIDAWRQRETARVERDGKEKEAVEREEAEHARVRGMAEEDRDAEGIDRARCQREEKARKRAAFYEPAAAQDDVADPDPDARLTQVMLDYAKQRLQPRKGNSKARGLWAEDTSLHEPRSRRFG